MKAGPLTIAAIGALLAMLIWLAFFWSPAGFAPTADSRAAAASSNPPTGGDFVLQGADGPVRLTAYRGKVVLIYFGYTFCPDVCPTALASMAQAFSALSPAELERTRGVFISVDPERDTMDVLKAYAPFFHPNIVGATGSPDQVADVARRYGAGYVKQKPDQNGLYSVDHTSFTYVVAPDGTLVETLPHGTPPQRMIDAIRARMGAVRNP